MREHPGFGKVHAGFAGVPEQDQPSNLPLRYYGEGMTPHRCPVCSGCGNVPLGFYTGFPMRDANTTAEVETCRACSGRGVLWR